MEQYDLRGCMFDVFSLPVGVVILNKFPKLAIFPEFKVPVRTDRNKLLKYIIAVYDKRGLRVYEQNLPKRKRMAAELAGWIPDAKGEFTPAIKAIIEGKDKSVNKMIVRYCKIHKSPRYAALVGMEETFYSILERMVDGSDMKAADISTFKSFETEIEDRATEFLNGDSTREIVQQVYEDIELEQLELRPEDIAKKLKSGKSPVDFDPYEGYTAEELRLIVDREDGEEDD
jgi:hypothetical protein